MGYRFFLELAFTIPFILSSTLFLFLAMKGLFSIYSQPRYFKGVPVLSFRTGWLGQMVECFYLIDPTPLIQRGYDMVSSAFQKHRIGSEIAAPDMIFTDIANYPPYSL